MLINTVICDWGVSITLTYRNSFEFTVTRLLMKMFCTALPAVVKRCQLALKFLPVHSQLDIRTANFLQKFIATENSLYYLFSLTARRKLFTQFDNVTISCHFHIAILDSLPCTNVLNSEASVNTI